MLEIAETILFIPAINFIFLIIFNRKKERKSKSKWQQELLFEIFQSWEGAKPHRSRHPHHVGLQGTRLDTEGTEVSLV